MRSSVASLCSHPACAHAIDSGPADFAIPTQRPLPN